MSIPTPAHATELLGGVVDPVFERPLSETRMLGPVEADARRVAATVTLPTHAYGEADELRRRIETAVREAYPDVAEVAVETPVETRGLNTGGAIGLRVKNVIAVGSGKGGVGKSTVAASLAFGLQQFGASVGLMDADVYGPSIPHMLGTSGAEPAAKEVKDASGQTIPRIVPIEKDGLKMMSMGFFVEEEQAVVWRGPMLHKALTQFLKDTDWGELDYLVIDLPPGTGDVSLTLSQLLGLAGAVIVCTPQKVALLDAVKAIAMYQQVKVPILGIVENMSGDIFGRGGAREKAAEKSVPFLGEIPIETAVRVKGDEGRIADLFAEDNPAREPLLEVSRNVALEIARGQLTASAAMPTLEVL